MIKPLLAAKCPPSMTMDEYLAQLRFPLGATPKIDGIRCMTLPDGNGHTWGASRTLKPIPNGYIQQQLATLPPFLDGELTVGTNFQSCTSGIMTHCGNPTFTYWVFGCHIAEPDVTYNTVAATLASLQQLMPPFVKILLPCTIDNLANLDEIEQKYLANGAEGVMLRDFSKGYKYGRSTLKEQKLIAIKRFTDSEAIIDGFEELYRNHNEPTINALGHTERSSHMENRVPAGTLGALLVHDRYSNVQFAVGSGFSQQDRDHIWRNRESLRNATIKYKHQPHGVKDKPRAPIFLGFRHDDDSPALA